MSTTPTTTKYLVVVYVVTSGLDEGDLGSDEEEIVLLTWLVIDVTNCKVVAVHCKYVKPRSADVNVNVLSDVARTKFGLTEDLIKSGQPLEQVVEEFDQYAKSKLQCDGGRSFRLITDGQLHLRQVIHPEACKKGITLPDYFHSFHDLKKEFRKFYRNNDFQTIDEMLNCNLSFFFQCITSHPCLPNLPETSVYFIFKQLQPITCIQFNSNSSLNIAGFTKYQRYCKDLEKLISFS